MIQKSGVRQSRNWVEEISQGSQKEMKRSNAKFKKAIALCSLSLPLSAPLPLVALSAHHESRETR